MLRYYSSVLLYILAQVSIIHGNYGASLKLHIKYQNYPKKDRILFLKQYKEATFLNNNKLKLLLSMK